MQNVTGSDAIVEIRWANLSLLIVVTSVSRMGKTEFQCSLSYLWERWICRDCGVWFWGAFKASWSLWLKNGRSPLSIEGLAVSEVESSWVWKWVRAHNLILGGYAQDLINIIAGKLAVQQGMELLIQDINLLEHCGPPLRFSFVQCTDNNVTFYLQRKHDFG